MISIEASRTDPSGTVETISAEIGSAEFGPLKKVGETTVKAPKPQWFCWVRCPALLKSEKAIIGYDATQAEILAHSFVVQLMRDRGYELGTN